MSEVPKEYLVAKASRKFADYFSEKFLCNWNTGRVPVVIDDVFTSFYFFPCDDHGFPKAHNFHSIEIQTPLASTGTFEEMMSQQIDVLKVEVSIESPMLVMQDHDAWWDPHGKPYVFMWQGRKRNGTKIPVSELNVKELMILAQKAIQSREGIILDEATKNKIYK